LKVPYELLEQIPGFAVLFLPVSHSPSDAPYRRFLRLDEEQLSQLELIFLKMQKEFAQQPVGYEAALHGALVEYLVHLSRCYPRTATKEATTSALAQIAPIIDAVHDHTTHAWTLEEMAGIGAMSTSKLLVVFREATGMTPIEYLIRQRIRDSMFELRNTRDSVTEIAYRVGFSDSNYFARQFRKVMEMSPTEYRRAGHG
jgi:AraC-like DNA-binding protein